MDPKDLPPLNSSIIPIEVAGEKRFIGALRDAHKIYLQSQPFNQREIATLWSSQHMEEARQVQLKYYSRCTIKIATLQLPSVESKDIEKLTRG